MQLCHEWLMAFTSLLQVCVVQNLSGKLTRKINKFKRFDIYEELAKASGGWILEVEKTDRKSSELLTNMTTHQIEGKIFVIEKCSNPKFEFIVEKVAELGYIIVNSRSNMKHVTITSPSGSTNAYVVNVKDESLFVGEIKEPIDFGLWKATVELHDQRKFYKAMVAVKSKLYLSTFLYLGDVDMTGTLLTPGLTYLAHIIFDPEIKDAKLLIKLFDERRNELGKEISPTGGFMLKFVCPDKAFFMETSGILSDGSKFQRWNPVIYNVTAENRETGRIDEILTPRTSPEITGEAIATERPNVTSDIIATESPNVTSDIIATESPNVTSDIIATISQQTTILQASPKKTGKKDEILTTSPSVLLEEDDIFKHSETTQTKAIVTKLPPHKGTKKNP